MLTSVGFWKSMHGFPMDSLTSDLGERAAHTLIGDYQVEVRFCFLSCSALSFAMKGGTLKEKNSTFQVYGAALARNYRV